ncbi:MAG: DUF3084 domain-containing protein [Candidatus Eremiobacteraeota bacterium]|nr:DUF3084 domain-containing protein [Candidatus Eremiobacteraeota bacterium]
MGDWLRGMLLVVFIVCLAGAIAYVGDRVGHQVGRKRLSLFGIRPRYTSTIVAIGTGMLIALVVTVGALIASNSVKTAFFHLNAVNSRVIQLQAQSDQLEKHVRNDARIVGVGDLMNDSWIVLKQNESPEDRYRQIKRFFDDTSRFVDRRYIPLGLRRNKTPPAEVERKLRDFAQNYVITAALSQAPAVVLAIADENLFANDEVHFNLVTFQDRTIFTAQQTVASIIVPAGATTDLRFELLRLKDLVTQKSFELGMPIQFAQNVVISLSNSQGDAMQSVLRSGRGQYRLVAQATTPVFTDMGVVPVTVSLNKI